MPDITITVSASLDARIKQRWGTLAAYKQWVRDVTRADLRNDRLAQAQISAQAILGAAQAAADAEDAAL